MDPGAGGQRGAVSRAGTIARCGALAAVAVGCGASDPRVEPARAEEARVAVAAVDTATANALSRTFRAAAARAMTSVVYISVERAAAAPDSVPEALRRFHGWPEEGSLPPDVGAGSGVVFQDDGVVLTNHHVVADATYLVVRLRDGREYAGEVVGSDPNTDIALVRIPARGLAPATLGRSGGVQVGDWVLALGNPLGLAFTVTAGIVSATGRQLGGSPEALQAFLQTDAAINPGNSGGPLIDLSGNVIGINSAISGGERFIGYGFAVPIDLARRVAADLLEYGYVRRPRLGVRVSDVTAVDAEAYGLADVAGAEVNTVDPGSPAAAGGLAVGDVIVVLDGEDIAGATPLTTLLAQRRPGDRVTVGYVRDGRRREARVTLGEFPRPPEEPVRRDAGEGTLLGFGVGPVTPEVLGRPGTPPPGGALVTRVEAFSSAQRSGIRVGQIVTAVNREPVASPEDLARVQRRLREGAVISVRLWDPDLGETIVNYRARR